MREELAKQYLYNCKKCAYHVPDESGELEGGLEEDEVDDGQQQLGSVEPEQLVARLQHHVHGVVASHAAALQR